MGRFMLRVVFRRMTLARVYDLSKLVSVDTSRFGRLQKAPNSDKIGKEKTSRRTGLEQFDAL